MKNELAEVWQECSIPGWDGYGAIAVTPETLFQAENVLKALPINWRSPSIGAEPDGSIALEWVNNESRRLSVSVTADGTLHYAALFEKDRIRGSDTFSESVPAAVLRLIDRVVG